MRIKARTVAAVTVIGVLATAILAGTAFAQDASDDGGEPVTFIVGYTQPANTYNPIRAILTQEYEAFSITYPMPSTSTWTRWSRRPTGGASPPSDRRPTTEASRRTASRTRSRSETA
ncbi:MAG: hypothetical protein U0V56_02135 [Actinomycetota bacterium]